jgi:hypothetical protein
MRALVHSYFLGMTTRRQLIELSALLKATLARMPARAFASGAIEKTLFPFLGGTAWFLRETDDVQAGAEARPWTNSATVMPSR